MGKTKECKENRNLLDLDKNGICHRKYENRQDDYESAGFHFFTSTNFVKNTIKVKNFL